MITNISDRKCMKFISNNNALSVVIRTYRQIIAFFLLYRRRPLMGYTTPFCIKGITTP